MVTISSQSETKILAPSRCTDKEETIRLSVDTNLRARKFNFSTAEVVMTKFTRSVQETLPQQRQIVSTSFMEVLAATICMVLMEVINSLEMRV